MTALILLLPRSFSMRLRATESCTDTDHCQSVSHLVLYSFTAVKHDFIMSKCDHNRLTYVTVVQIVLPATRPFLSLASDAQHFPRPPRSANVGIRPSPGSLSSGPVLALQPKAYGCRRAFALLRLFSVGAKKSKKKWNSRRYKNWLLCQHLKPQRGSTFKCWTRDKHHCFRRCRWRSCR